MGAVTQNRVNGNPALGPFSMEAETRAFRWAEKSNMYKW